MVAYRASFVNALRDLLHIKDILIVTLTPIVLLPFLLVDGGGPVAKCAYCVLILAIFWLTEAFPIAVTSLIPVFLFPIVGVLSVKDTAQEYMNDTNMLFVGGLIVAAAIEHWNIHKRIALRILMFVGAETKWIMAGLMLPTWFLSMWISNTATTAMMAPIANAILLQLKETEDMYKNLHKSDGLKLDEIQGKDESNVRDKEVAVEYGNAQHESQKDGPDFDNIPDNVLEGNDNVAFARTCKCLSLCIAYASNCGGIGSLTGTGANLVMKGQLDLILGEYGIKNSPLNFATWLAFGAPLSFVLTAVVWFWMYIFFIRGRDCCQSTNKAGAARVKVAIRAQYEKLGPITFFLNGICLSAGTREPLKPLISWKVAAEKVPWGVVFLLGGGFAMAKAATKIGMSAWVGEKLAVLDYLDPWVLNLVLCYIVAALTEMTSNTATCTLMMPIVANLAINLKQSSIYLMFPTAIACSFAFMLPVATPPNAVIFSYGYVTVSEMVSTLVLAVVYILDRAP
ncbi:Na(+)/citrate cotransporter-like [Dreissena polymorpha]|uniref:Na(+)/citrate cotransporter-like n=1 Tax=Dreissena polymorpha TaxID=45954 RepID=UPI002264BBAC|nr:Na(+)/citrate cotransporter-like [Dreissena polymorpha]